MRHKLSTAVYAQGWLEGQIEDMVTKAIQKQDEDPTQLLVASQIQEQWTVVSATLDDLVRENNELKRKLSVVESAFQ